MPLTAKGATILASMKKEYGSERGEQVFYASRNKGTISGVDCAVDSEASDLANKIEKLAREGAPLAKIKELLKQLEQLLDKVERKDDDPNATTQIYRLSFRNRQTANIETTHVTADSLASAFRKARRRYPDKEWEFMTFEETRADADTIASLEADIRDEEKQLAEAIKESMTKEAAFLRASIRERKVRLASMKKGRTDTSERADHWINHSKVGKYQILEGAGTDGGSWAAKGRGEMKIFRGKHARDEAIEHAELSESFRDDTNAQSGTLPRQDQPNDISNLQVKLAEAIALGNTEDETSIRSTIAAMDAAVAMDGPRADVYKPRLTAAERKEAIKNASKAQLYAWLDTVKDPAIKREVEKELDDRANRGDSLHDRLDTALALATKIDGAFKESDHPRDGDGKFGSGGGKASNEKMTYKGQEVEFKGSGHSEGFLKIRFPSENRYQDVPEEDVKGFVPNSVKRG